jgi:hypothetical protein
MDSFHPTEVTQKAKKIVKENPTDRKIEIQFSFPQTQKRYRDLSALSFERGKKNCVIQPRQGITLVLGQTKIDVRYVEHLIEEGQLEICGWILKQVKDRQKQEGKQTQTIQKILKEIESGGLDSIAPYNNRQAGPPKISGCFSRVEPPALEPKITNRVEIFPVNF